jgi:hypothetical protein
MPLLATIRSTILLAFKDLPLLLISFIGFLAIGLGNLSLFMLFLGHAMVVPLVTSGIQAASGTSGQLVVPNDASQLVPNDPSTGSAYGIRASVMPTYWMAHVSFFFGYILMNAIDIYNLPADNRAADWMVVSRKTRAATLIASTVVMFALFAALRYYLTGSETSTGMAIGVFVLGGIGMASYQIATKSFGARSSDMFGISQQMVTQGTGDKKPMTCVYAPRA